VEIAEEDLTPERSSKAVNKCIVDLSYGRFDLLDVVGRWGDVSIVILWDMLCIRAVIWDCIFIPKLRKKQNPHLLQIFDFIIYVNFKLL
jgi:hypothetical protein